MAIAVFVGLLFFAIGIGVLIGGIVAIVKRRRQIANSLSATGVVSAFATEMGRRGNLYYPLVRFKVASGQPMSFQSGVGSSPAGYSVGQQVKVLYDAGNPQQAEIDSMSSQWFVPGCMITMGVMFTIVGVLLLVLMILVMINQS
jgi:hypothetical protein